MPGQVDRRRHKRQPGQAKGAPMFRRDGSAIWRARYPDPIKGGTAQHERSFATRKEAEEWLAEQTTAVRYGSHIARRQGSRLFREVADEWKHTWINLQPRTRSGYDAILRVHVLPHFGNAKVADVDARAIQAFITELSLRRKRETVLHVYNVLRSVLGLATRRHYLAANPCQGITMPKEEREERTFLTHSEVEALAAVITPHYRALVLTAAYTGLRAGELHGLRWKRLDLLHGRLRVEESLKPVGKKWADGQSDLMFGPPKTKGSRRTVGLPAFLVQVLTAHQMGPVPGGSGPDALVFTTPSGTPIRQSLFYRRHFKPAVWEALPQAKHGCRFHDLRHTFASLMTEHDVGLIELSTLMGHTNTKTTSDRYGHLQPGAEQRAAAALNDGRLEARATNLAAPRSPTLGAGRGNMAFSGSPGR